MSQQSVVNSSSLLEFTCVGWADASGQGDRSAWGPLREPAAPMKEAEAGVREGDHCQSPTRNQDYTLGLKPGPWLSD